MIKGIRFNLCLFASHFLLLALVNAEPTRIAADPKFIEKVVKFIDGQTGEIKTQNFQTQSEEPFFWIKSESAINTILRVNINFALSNKEQPAASLPLASPTKTPGTDELESIDTDFDTKPAVDILADNDAKVSEKFTLTAFIERNNLIIRHSLASQPKERYGVSVALTAKQTFLLKGAAGTSLLVFTTPDIEQQKGALLCPIKLIGRQAWEDVDVIGKSDFVVKYGEFTGSSSLRGSFKSGVNPGKALATLITSENILESKVNQDQSEGRTPAVEVTYYRKNSNKKVGTEDILTEALPFEQGYLSASLGGEIVLTGPAGQVKTTRHVKHLSLTSIALNGERSIELKGRGRIRAQSLECVGVFERQEKLVTFQKN